MPTNFSDNFDADAVGSTQVANWTNNAGSTQPTVTAGSTLSAPNWFNSAKFAISRTGTQPASAAMQLSSYARTDGTNNSAIVPNLVFNTNGVVYQPIIHWTGNQLFIYKYGLSGATIVSGPLATVTIPAYANNAGYTVKFQFDPSTGGGPTLSAKLWPYGTAEPTPWTATAQDNGTIAGLGPTAGDTFLIRALTDGGLVVAGAQGIDDYYEGTVGTTFTGAATPVTTLTITVSGNNRVLTWPADAQATAYEVYRGSTATTLAFVATVAAGTTTYTDAARPGGNIYYAVIAVH